MKKEMGKIIGKLIHGYKLGNVVNINPITEGIINNNYTLYTDQNKFFIKEYSKRDNLKIEYIKKVEDFMIENNIPAIKSIILDKENNIVIYPFIESNRTHNYNNKDYFLMGQMLGRIHKVSFQKEIPKEIKRFYFKNKEYKQNINKYLDIINKKNNKSEEDILYKEYLEKKIHYSKNFNFDFNIENNSIIHGDFHPGNILFDEQKTKIIAICDWEKCEYAPREYDLAKSYLNLSFGSGEENLDICLEIKKYLLEGYRSVLEISDTEFENGIKIRIKDYLFTSYLEDKYLINNDNRSSRFVKNWINILDFFCKNN